MPYVNSTAITQIEWANGTLSIWFRSSGRRYDFHGVPMDVYLSFLRASSHGDFYHDHIKGRY